MKTIIHIDASDYYGGTVYGVDEDGRLWEREPQEGSQWHSDDGMKTLNPDEVIEDWFGK